MTSLGVALHQDIEKGPVWVAGDEVELSQVLTNVFRNALEAMSGSRKRILKIHLHTDPLNAHLLLEDSGTGLAEEATERAGQAFFSTKEHGLGIGLSLCHAIVSRHDGTLELLNAQGGGASLRLVLPRTAGQAQP
jgi:C4-dicarboxylate-specific signal transduction histidine kinase